MMVVKTCTKCKVEKSIEEFHNNKPSKDGRLNTCKDCCNERARKYHQDNREAKKEYDRKYHQDNRESQNKKAIEKRQNCKEVGTCQRCPNPSRPGKTLCKVCADKKVKYHLDRKRTNPQYKVACDLRGRMNRAIKGVYKSGSAVEDLGCSIDELIEHIARLFQDGMSWNNQGEWHLDHVAPLASFNLSNRRQFLEACHYTNLQPLWAIDNLKKGSKKWYHFGDGSQGIRGVTVHNTQGPTAFP